jgi:hypothetical protein
MKFENLLDRVGGLCVGEGPLAGGRQRESRPAGATAPFSQVAPDGEDGALGVGDDEDARRACLFGR